jgi:hypothetical protein
MSTRITPNSDQKFLLISIFLGILGLLSYAASKFVSGQTVVIASMVGILGFMITHLSLAIRRRDSWGSIKSFGFTLLIVIFCTYLFLFIFLFFFQDYVANCTKSFFQPQSISAGAAETFTAPDITDIDITTPDDIHLRGWLVRNSTIDKTPLLIFFNGSGSESSGMISLVRQLEGWSVALVNYRGFGMSEGSPNHANTLTDALLIYDYFSAQMDIDSSRIVVMGYSLGTGIAVYLSEQRPINGTILVSPHDYWTVIGINDSPFYFPLSGIMNHYYDSISRAPNIQTPLLCVIGLNDTFVRPELSRKLANAWDGDVTLIEFPGEDHNLLFRENNSWQEILRFLSQINQGS